MICAQANKIYKDVNELMKNKKGKPLGKPIQNDEI